MTGQRTVREDGNATLREGRGGRRGPGLLPGAHALCGSQVLRQIPSASAEADIYIVDRKGERRVLKLYRFGVEPRSDVLRRIMDLGREHPQAFIRTFEAGFDAASGRWYELQEYAQAGTLEALLDDRAWSAEERRASLFDGVARQVGAALTLLHGNDVLHLDLKPSNILLRSVEPLDLGLIDFGIATLLSPDVSKKFTQTRGTPMYQSPESWSGGMGRASDWWGLGMILLEIAAGAHPFQGLPGNVIALSIATRPVPIPKTLEGGRAELLRGLLTRDMDRRWRWEQVSRWLAGQRGIPQHFEEVEAAGEALAAGPRPLRIMGQDCASLEDAARIVVRDEEAWTRGRELLLRGYLRRWLEERGEFEACIDLDRLVSGTEDADEKLFRLVNDRGGDDVPFVFCGRPVTLPNLLLSAWRALKREGAAAAVMEADRKIAASIADGRLLACLELYAGRRGADVGTLRAALHNLEGKPSEDIVGLLDFYLRPGRYYAPFLGGAASPDEVVAASAELPRPPLTVERWGRINAGDIAPAEVVERMRSAATYHDVLRPSGLRVMLLAAAWRNAPEAIRALEAQGADPNARDRGGRTALMIAAKGNASEAIRALVECGADLNARTDDERAGQSSEAGRPGTDVREIWRNCGTALTIAAANRSLEALRALLECGADPNAAGCFGGTPLVNAALFDVPEAVRLLVHYGAHVDARPGGRTALMWARSPEAVRALADCGANVTARGQHGRTALMEAAFAGWPDVVGALLECGADVDARAESGGTALMEARSPEVVWLLIDGGANVNARDRKGVTALIWAAFHNAPGAVEALLERGADVNARNGKGRTALAFAGGEVARILRRYGGEE